MKYYSENVKIKTRLCWYAILWRVVSMCVIFAFIGVSNIYIKEGYAEFAMDGQSVLLPVLMGSATTKFGEADLDQVPNKSWHSLYNRFWDAHDNIHKVGPNWFFVATNMIITPSQKRSVCAEYPSQATKCDPERQTDCTDQRLPMVTLIEDISLPSLYASKQSQSGERTGDCVKESMSGNFTCEFRGWCPPESPLLPSKNRPIFNQSRHFTVEIKNSVYFHQFGLKLRNNESSYLNDPKNKSTQHGRVFKIEDMVSETGVTSFDKVAMRGAVIKIQIEWRCYLGIWRPFDRDYLSFHSDEWTKENCLQTYKFIMLEKGWSKTNAHYYPEDQSKGLEFSRHLYKIIGIDFRIEVTYHVTRFSIFNVIHLLVAGFAMWGSSEVIFRLIFSGFDGLFKPVWCCNLVHMFNSPSYKEKKTIRLPPYKGDILTPAKSSNNMELEKIGNEAVNCLHT